MSGGTFEYIQYRMGEVAHDIREKFEDYADTCTPQTIARFKDAVKTLERAEMMVHRIDWFISCDDSEESFNQRWDEEGIDD